MKVMLSGMPELRLGLNDKILFESTGRSKSKAVELEDVKFHQCVRLSRYRLFIHFSFLIENACQVSLLWRGQRAKKTSPTFTLQL